MANDQGEQHVNPFPASDLLTRLTFGDLPDVVAAPKADRAELSEIFTSLCVRVAEDLARKGYASRTIGIKLRYADFQAVTRDITLPACTIDAIEIRKAAGECLKRVPLTQRIRLLGVRASGLVLLGEVENETGQAQGELPLFA